jgi:hypothetical protein
VTTATAEKPTSTEDTPNDDAREDFIGHAPGKTAEPIVDLDLEKPEQTVRSGGKLYRLKTLDEFGLARQQRLNRDFSEFSELYRSSEELSDTDEQRLVMLLDRVFGDVLDAPASVKKKLTETQKAAVVLGFMLAPSMQQAAQIEQEKAREEASSTTSS